MIYNNIIFYLFLSRIQCRSYLLKCFLFKSNIFNGFWNTKSKNVATNMNAIPKFSNISWPTSFFRNVYDSEKPLTQYWLLINKIIAEFEIGQTMKRRWEICTYENRAKVTVLFKRWYVSNGFANQFEIKIVLKNKLLRNNNLIIINSIL